MPSNARVMAPPTATVKRALWYVPPISSASSAIRNICAKPMRFITSSRKSEGINNSATPLRPILPIYIRSFIGAAYRRISRAPCATSTSRRTDGGGLPIYTAISFAPSASQASPAHNGKAKAPHGAKPENKYDNMLYIMISLAWLIALSLAVCLASTAIKRRLLGRKERRRALKRLDLGPGASTRRSPATLVTIMAGMLGVL